MTMNTDQIMLACHTDGTTAARWLAVLEYCFNVFHIDSPLERAAFLAQAGYESTGLRSIEENLNYSATGLQTVFGKYFDQVSAVKYQRNPVAIANRVYANRFGNGDEASGDGWKYRGRGIFQVTFHDNYQLTEDALGIACVDNPDLLLIRKNAADSAAAFWNRNGLGVLARKQDFDGITQRISGSLRTADKRRILYNDARKAFGV